MRVANASFLCVGLIGLWSGGISFANEKANPAQLMIGRAKVNPSSPQVAEAILIPFKQAVEDRLREIDQERFRATSQEIQALIEERDRLGELLVSETARLETLYSRAPWLSLADSKVKLKKFGEKTALLVKQIQEAEAIDVRTSNLRKELRETLESAQITMMKVKELQVSGDSHPHVYREPLRDLAKIAVVFVAPVASSVYLSQHWGAFWSSLFGVMQFAGSAVGVGVYNMYDIYITGGSAARPYFKYALPIMKQMHQVFWNEVKDVLKFSSVEAWEMHVHHMSCSEILSAQSPALKIEQLSEVFGTNSALSAVLPNKVR